MKNYLSTIEVRHDRSVGHSSPFHQHDTYEIYLFLGGTVSFFTDKKGYQLTRGDLILIPPGCWHRAQTFDQTVYERAYLNLPLEVLTELSTPNTDLRFIFPKIGAEPAIFHLGSDAVKQLTEPFDGLVRCLNLSTYGNDLQGNLLIMQILLLINELRVPVKEIPYAPLPPMLVDLLAFIDRHLAEDLSMKAVSGHLHLTGSHISRSFKRFMGISLQDYIIKKRLNQARDCLDQGASVQEAALQSGYGNYAHFIRSFTEHYGISPGRYRRQRAVNIKTRTE